MRKLFSRARPWTGITRLLGFGVSSNLSPEQQGLCPQARRSSWGCPWGSSWFLLEPRGRRKLWGGAPQMAVPTRRCSVRLGLSTADIILQKPVPACSLVSFTCSKARSVCVCWEAGDHYLPLLSHGAAVKPQWLSETQNHLAFLPSSENRRPALGVVPTSGHTRVLRPRLEMEREGTRHFLPRILKPPAESTYIN